MTKTLYTPEVIGKKFGRLLVLKFLGRTRNDYHNYLLCKCECGTKKAIRVSHVLSNQTRSCGCLIKEFASKNLSEINTRHGMCDTPEYKTWGSIKARCYNKNSVEYFRYGGRGIGMSKIWKYSFETFYKDMGLKPSPNHSIDRINNNGNYSKQNCRWATPKQQSANRSVSLPLHVYKLIEDIQKQNNISFRTAYLRFYRSANYILKRDKRKKKENEQRKQTRTKTSR